MQFTIITPTFNCGPQVRTAIESVRQQEFDDYEHLIIDGGSGEETLSILREYPALRLVSEPDSGIYDAMNKGIRLARGHWLYFLGADDRLNDAMVLSDIAKHLDDETDILYGDVTSTRFGGRYDGPFDPYKIYQKNICHQSIFFCARVFEIIGTFDQRYRAHADWDHNMKWLLDQRIQSRYVDRVVAVYADGGYSSTNDDPDFEADFTFNYVNYGRNTLPTWLCVRRLASEAGRSLLRFDILRALVCVLKSIQVGGIGLTRLWHR